MWWVLLVLCTAARYTHCLESRIIGGHDASISEYPYQVSIHYNGELACGGSIISRNWVLTAAHCLYGLNPLHLKVRLGSTYHAKDGVEFSDVKFFWHAKFNEATYNYDVALIMLPSPINFSATMQPINLATVSSSVRPNENAVVTGWGRLRSHGSMSSKLQTLTMPIVDQNECNKMYASISQKITDDMLCAGILVGGQDTCNGDSGGPLVQNGVQIGIVSWGNGCAKPKYPGVYTRVSSVRSWIKERANV